MKISSISLEAQTDGLNEFSIPSLGNIVILAGSNGSGKTRLLKLIERYIVSLKNGLDSKELKLNISSIDNNDEEILTPETVSKIEIVNYSHYDAQLQTSKGYTPYVISKAKDLLRKHDYAETALNALLLLDDMSNGYSSEYKDKSEWERFVQGYATPLNITLTKDVETGQPLLFTRKTEIAGLSPGQQYLLRIAVACYCNEKNNNIIFLLDEPELHLHPKAQIDLIKILRDKFPDAQFWISTHSLSLISFITIFDPSTTVLYMENGNTHLFRSNSGDLLNGLIGSENNRFAIRQFMAAPDEYACNRFAIECLTKPNVSDALKSNPQNELIKQCLAKNNIIVDFGVGKCRLLEELSNDKKDIIGSSIQYFAYDKYDTYAEQAKHNMSIYGSSSANYFNDKEALAKKVDGNADYVFMINVLHEIDPKYWIEEFSFIQKLLKEDGKLVIVEREELTVGESPYSNGFLMINEKGAIQLFGKDNCEFIRHSDPKKKHIVKHSINKEGLGINKEHLVNCINTIIDESIKTIDELKHTEVKNDIDKFKTGIRLAFYLNQYANANLIKSEFS